MKYFREFNGTEGERSVGSGGVEQLEADLDVISKILDGADPDGGLREENLHPGAFSDTVTGTRTVDQGIATAAADTGTLTQLFSWIAKLIKGITGKADWKTAPAKTLEQLAAETTTLVADLNTEEAALASHKVSNDHDARYNTKAEITSALALKANLASPTFTGMVSGITKAMVGLGNVDNTSDLNKPISNAVQSALNLLATWAALNTHKASDDHDGRYIPRDNTTPIWPDGQHQPATKEYVDVTLAGATLGQIADSSLTDQKFGADYKHGGLSNLAPTFVAGDRASLVAAINALLTIVQGIDADMAPEDILAALLTVDGATSGLDAQYLAGKDAPAGDLVGTTATQSLSNKTLAAPRVTSSGSLNDSAGNELIKFPATVGSAVNEITITNAAAGNAPGFAASGNDSNISLNNVPKGTGRLQEAGENVARFKNTVGASFNSGTTTKVITDSWVTADTLIIVSPTGTAKGQWSVASAAGAFTITSTVAETVAVAFDWAGVK